MKQDILVDIKRKRPKDISKACRLLKMNRSGVTTFEWTKKLRDLSINFKS